MPNEITIPAVDGYPLAVTSFPPAVVGTGDAKPPIALINGATGVKRGYYRAFARHLAGSGMHTLTWDYRGIGDSRPDGPLSAMTATMADWGRLDLTGMLQWIYATYPDHTVVTVGHSVGGQLLGLTDEVARVRAACCVGAQCGYYRLWPWPRRWLLGLFWHLFLPAAVKVAGRYPSRLLGMGEDLPPQVARQWAAWCRNRHFMVDFAGVPLAQTFDLFGGSLLALSFSDDTYAPEKSVATLVEFFTSATHRRHRHLRPADVEARKIGHFGFFRERFRNTLWRKARRWLWAQVLNRPLSDGPRHEPVTI
ncbi:MAG: alpha/beta fold hydrolase [Acidobacteriota bacterium]